MSEHVATTTREIPLSRGLVALVDAADFDGVTRAGRWYADIHRGGPLAYAAHNVYRDGVRLGTERLHAFLTGWALVDHINGDGLDNRRANLRPATRRENQHNRGPQCTNRSGYKGVSWDASRRLWMAALRIDGRPTNLGRYATAEEAARVYDQAARDTRGDFAWLNFPEGANS